MKEVEILKNEAQNRVGIFWQKLIFELKLFFQRPLEKFLWTLRPCSRYLKGPANPYLYVSKKIETTRRTNQIICQEKWKKMRFCKMKLVIRLEYSDKTSFLSWNFFSKAFRNFLWTLRPCSRDRNVRLTLHFTPEKKSWPHDAPIRLYARKSEKT